MTILHDLPRTKAAANGDRPGRADRRSLPAAAGDPPDGISRA